MLLPLAILDSMPFWVWAAFFAFIIAMLALDLGVLQRNPHAVTMKEALAWCAVWFALALGFNGLLLGWRGSEAASSSSPATSSSCA